MPTLKRTNLLQKILAINFQLNIETVAGKQFKYMVWRFASCNERAFEIYVRQTKGRTELQKIVISKMHNQAMMYAVPTKIVYLPITAMRQ